jgi:hypothetical protein
MGKHQNDLNGLRELIRSDPIDDNSSSGVSELSSGRGSRHKTFHELNKLYNQLKVKYTTKRQEWLSEKEELVKQALKADESARILLDLKGILDQMRRELKNEESKRITAQKQHASDRDVWKKKEN